MLSLEQLRSYYPKALQNYGRFIIREYLQYKILEIVFESPYQAVIPRRHLFAYRSRQPAFF